MKMMLSERLDGASPARSWWRPRRKALCPRAAAAVAVAAAWVLTLAALAPGAAALTRMQAVYSWGQFRFAFENRQQRDALVASGAYTPGNQVPFDVDVEPMNNTVFLALPWLLPGAAVTLARVVEPGRVESPLLAPFPDWSWQNGANGSRGCDGLTSVFRTFIDRCGRLWVIDTGLADLLDTAEDRCPPQLVAFDLRRGNAVAFRHRFAGDAASCRMSLKLNVVVEVMGECEDNDAYAYVADTGAYYMDVFSTRLNTSWQVNDFHLYPDVNSRRIRVGPESFELMDGVLGLALSPRLRPAVGGGAGDRWLFFHPFSSRQEGRVLTSALRNASLYEDGAPAPPDAFRFIGERHSQAAGEACSSRGILFFSQVSDFSISCWNTRKPYNRYNFGYVERDEAVIRFVTSMKTVMDASGRESLWAIANNGQRLFAGTFRPNVTGSVTVLRGDTETLTAGTVCSL